MKIITILLSIIFITSANANYYDRYYYDSDQAERDAIWAEMNRQRREADEYNRYYQYQLCMQRKNLLISMGRDLIGLPC